MHAILADDLTTTGVQHLRRDSVTTLFAADHVKFIKRQWRLEAVVM